jgi:peptide/nickel transport system substrate-binding protein
MHALLTLLLLCSTAAWTKPLRYAEDRAPAIVNPLFATTMSEARVNELVFEGLFTDDQELRSAPRLAESWELAEDGMSMTLALREGVTWHDGKPLIAQDVAFTIGAMKDRGTASTEAGRAGWIKSAEVIDNRHIRLHFVDAEYAPEDKLHFKILPDHLFNGTTVKRTDPFRNGPIGTGPMSVTSFNDDNSISLARYNQYWGKAGVDEFVMREVADHNYQAKLLIYQSLEALVRVLPRDLAVLQNDRNIELYPYQSNSWWYLGFNLKNPTWEDDGLREAISYLINVEELLRPIGTGDLLSGPFVKSSPYYNHDVPARRYDPAKAQELLESAGYTLQGRQWEKDGKPLTVRVATLSNLETAQDVLINMQSQLQSQGVTLEPTFLGVAEWKQRVWRDREFDVILSQWTFDRNEDIYEQFHSSGTRNFVAYENTDVDRLLDEARVATDPQQKKALLREVHLRVANDTPMVFLWTLDSYSALSTSVKNVVVHPFYFFTWATDWTTE